jgi:hypothetical protein
LDAVAILNGGHYSAAAHGRATDTGIERMHSFPQGFAVG